MKFCNIKSAKFKFLFKSVKFGNLVLLKRVHWIVRAKSETVVSDFNLILFSSTFRYCFSSEDVDAMFEYLKEISTPGNSFAAFRSSDFRVQRVMNRLDLAPASSV